MATCSAAWGQTAVQTPAQAETVVLLHGLFRTSRSMSAIESALRDHGFDVLNLGYPSLEEPIERHAERVRAAVAQCCAEDERVHFVTHSMGGIIVRYYLESDRLDNVGRVVMLSPPNSGSEVIDALGDSAAFRKGAGPAAGQLRTGERGLPASLGPVGFELGIVAGSKSINPLFSWLIPGADDGAVSVQSAKVAGMTDFIVLPYTHTFIMDADEVHRQTLHFLVHGRFDHRTVEGPKGAAAREDRTERSREQAPASD